MRRLGGWDSCAAASCKLQQDTAQAAQRPTDSYTKGHKTPKMAHMLACCR